MAPAVVKMVAMPDAFEDSSKPPTTAPRSPANLLFPRAEPYRPPKAAQDAHIKPIGAKARLMTEALEPPASIFATRGLEVLLALAGTVRAPDAPRESIVALLQTAKTALAHYLSPAQRRKLETTASTIRATRAS